MNKVGQTFTADGEIREAYNQRNHKDGDRFVDISLSEIYTILIQEAGRWCESYASDLLVDINIITAALDNTDEWEHHNNFCKTENGNESLYFRFGFRANGVDHKEYIESAMKNEHEKYHYYRSIWDLRFTKDDEGKNLVKATLTRTA